MNDNTFLLLMVTTLVCTSGICIDGVWAAAANATATSAAATTAKAVTTAAGTTGSAAATTGSAAATTGSAAPTTGSANATTGSAAATTGSAAATTGSANATTGSAAATTAGNSTVNATVSNVTAAATTASSSAATTTFNPVPESQCHIPFYHAGGWHHTCVKYNDFGDYWCSLTANFTKDEDWRRCRSPDLKRFQCHLPFEYQGKNHTKCIPTEAASAHGRGAHHAFWCAVVPKIVTWSATATDWAYCEHESATGVAYLNAVGVRKDLPAAALVALASNATSNSSVGVAPIMALNSGAGGQSASSGATAGLGASATVGIAVGVVCSVLAVVAVVAGVAIRKRRRRGRDHKALLQTREKGTYGGVEASD